MALEAGGSSVRAWWRSLAQGTWRALVGKKFPGLLVLEFGISGQGDMRELLKIIKPRLAVFTNVVLSDFNPHASMEELSRELTILAQSIPSNGWVIINADDVHLKSLTNLPDQRVVTYALQSPANFRPTNIVRQPDGFSFEFNKKIVKLER